MPPTSVGGSGHALRFARLQALSSRSQRAYAAAKPGRVLVELLAQSRSFAMVAAGEGVGQAALKGELLLLRDVLS